MSLRSSLTTALRPRGSAPSRNILSQHRTGTAFGRDQQSVPHTACQNSQSQFFYVAQGVVTTSISRAHFCATTCFLLTYAVWDGHTRGAIFFILLISRRLGAKCRIAQAASNFTFSSGIPINRDISDVAHHPSRVDGVAGTGGWANTEQMVDNRTRHFWSANSHSIPIIVLSFSAIANCGLHIHHFYASSHLCQQGGIRCDTCRWRGNVAEYTTLLSPTVLSVAFFDSDAWPLVAYHIHFYLAIRKSRKFLGACYNHALLRCASTRGTRDRV